jgi:hypothetical protein
MQSMTPWTSEAESPMDDSKTGEISVKGKDVLKN